MAKFLIAGDLHGSAEYCRKLIDVFKRERAEKLLLLGDILYHGPRNPLPKEYNPSESAAMLNSIKEKIICVRGNCDSEVDQMVLNFPISSDYASVFADGVGIYLSHGHRATPPLRQNDVYVTGHTHVPLKENCGYIHLNPGSLSLPKDDSAHSCIIYENRVFRFVNLNGGEYDKIKI